MSTRAELLSLVNTIGTGEANTALEIRTVLTALVNGSTLTGDVQLVDCSDAYITANFDGTGLGISDRVGWAICNGNNGTRNWNGKVPLSYGVDYTTMGATGGSKDAVVVDHTHKTIASTGAIAFHNASTHFNDGGETWASGGTTDEKLTGIVNEGVSGTNKNMQPYTVVLAIMKL